MFLWFTLFCFFMFFFSEFVVLRQLFPYPLLGRRVIVLLILFFHGRFPSVKEIVLFCRFDWFTVDLYSDRADLLVDDPRTLVHRLHVKQRQDSKV